MPIARSLLRLAAAAGLTSAVLVAPLAASAQVTDPLPYQLVADSHFGYGCYGMCMCPVQVSTPMSGGFSFRRDTVGLLYTTYDLLGIDWTCLTTDTAGTKRTVHIQGSGTYEVGGESALTQRMVLQVSVDGSETRTFDSGRVPIVLGLPSISIDVWSNPVVCHDTLLHVVAAPVGTAGVGTAPLTRLLALPAPNPSAGATGLVFAAPFAVHARVEVFGVDGRRVALLLDADVAPGERRLTWDGRDRHGLDVGAGTFFVRATLGARTDQRTIVRLAPAEAAAR